MEQPVPEPKRDPGEKHRDKCRRMVLQHGFIGAKYNGNQVNPGVPTVEGELIRALTELGLLTEEKSTLADIRYTRCSRTDRGVSACCLISGLDLPESCLSDMWTPPSGIPLASDRPPNVTPFVHTLNGHLPSDIRAQYLVRVTSSFNAQKYCDSRIYEYIVPLNWLLNNAQTPKRLPAMDAIPGELEALYAREESPLCMSPVRRFMLAMYVLEGTHNFHNFTTGLKATDDYCKRHIISNSISAVAVKDDKLRALVTNDLALAKAYKDEWLKGHDVDVDVTAYEAFDDADYIVLRLHGMSFLKHQIRKMVGMAIAVARGCAPIAAVNAALSRAIIHTATAPGRLLYLVGPCYEAYHERFSHVPPFPNLEGIDETIGMIRAACLETAPDDDEAGFIERLDTHPIEVDASLTEEYRAMAEFVNAKRTRFGKEPRVF